MNTKNLAKKVDILIPTHNRPEYLQRILDYYDRHGRNFNFIITDSSSRENKLINKNIIARFTNMKILYKDIFSEDIVQSVKFGETVKFAKNKYCVYCGDDDFIIPNAIIKSVMFLEKNKDYVSAHGIYIGFHTFYILGKKIFRWRYRYSPHDIYQGSPIRRLNFHLGNYVHLIWSVRRTKIVKEIYKDYKDAKFDPKVLAVMGELLPDSLTVLHGKVKALNILFGARQYFGSVIGYYPTLPDAKKSGIYDLEYSKYKKAIRICLKRLGYKTAVKQSASIDSAFEMYNNFSFQEHLMNRIYFTFSKMPIFTQRILRFLHSLYLFSKPNNNKIVDISKEQSRYYPDFINIKNQILSHIK